ncbi:hypothetical protein [Ligilactobacillus ruminis]|uniref:hypothetical protein n=1 Tax=Ligilactobacillus ruminis TaxID=1623 RepID=UPI001473E84D|nr:hypothetical protein [Ligilactobacillus ruminis]NME31767.1 hypothetical protein [Ligilactobacillus ruminis]
MKYKIRYREYDEGDFVRGVSVIEARFFKIENGFVSVWFEDNDTQEPDLYINVNDVLMIKTL